MNNGKKSYVSRVMGVVLSGVIGLMSFGVQTVGSKDIEINPISSSVAAAENQKKSEQFYRTKTGKCYHKGTCGCLKKSKIQVSEKEIKQADLRPCSKCCK